MRNVLVRQESLLEWFDSKPQSTEIRRHLRSLSQDSVLCGALTKKQLKQGILERLDPETYSAAENLIDALCISDYSLSSAEESGLRKVSLGIPEILEIDEWFTSLQTHQNPIATGESRDAAFERIFQHLLRPGLKSITIVDPFFAEKSIKKQSVISWLVGKLATLRVPNVIVVSKIPKLTDYRHEPIARSQYEVVNSTALAIDEILVSEGFTGNFKTYLFHSTLHNRYWHFEYSEGSFTVELGKGVDAFRSPSTKESQQIHPCQFGLWGSLWTSLEWSPDHPSRLSGSRLDFQPRSSLTVLAPARSQLIA